MSGLECLDGAKTDDGGYGGDDKGDEGWIQGKPAFFG
jgi:hypothetical protein